MVYHFCGGKHTHTHKSKQIVCACDFFGLVFWAKTVDHVPSSGHGLGAERATDRRAGAARA